MNFACVCYGDKYSVEYVQKLYNMVKRNTTLPINFIVFTDHVKMHRMVEGDIDIRKFPETDLQGWWNKMQLFHPNTHLPGTTLYMDLDVVITDNIDCFFTYKPEADFVGMNDFNPVTKQWNSCIMRFNQSKWHDKLWMTFYNDRPNLLKRFPGDQNLISEFLKGTSGCESFPDSWTQSYKWFNRKGERFHSTKWTFEQDPNAKVCVFHGSPNPSDSKESWVIDLWK